MKSLWVVVCQKLLLLVLVAIAWGCTKMSEYSADQAAGLNGGFEISKKGLPVNWLMYTPKTVPNAEFEIILDREIYKEGVQSLKFDVKKCESIGGWHSPGFTNEFSEVGKFKGPGRYVVSFWVRNSNSKFNISAGGVEAKGGEMKTLIEEDKSIPGWQYFQYEVAVPEARWLRMELTILQPGVFWIDDIRIEKR